MLLILSASAFWACSQSVWINKSHFFNTNLPRLCGSSDLAVSRSGDSTAFPGGSKCDDSYFRQKHKRKAQTRRHSLWPNHGSSSGPEGSWQLWCRNLGGGVVTVHGFGSEGVIAIWRTVFPPSVEEFKAPNYSATSSNFVFFPE